VTTHPTHRSRPLAAALALVAICLLAAAPRASADSVAGPACNPIEGAQYSACLSLPYVGYRWWNAQVDVNVYLPEGYAREVVACDPDFRAVLWGDDGGGSQDDEIRHLWVGPGWPVAQWYGMSAALFAQNIFDDDLDEDDGTDELYARVSYFDCHTGLRRYFRTGTIVGNFG
jgi:hypothetical protein